MLEIYERTKSETKYNATRFLQMVQERGGLATAYYLLDEHAKTVSEGFTQLALRGRLDLTVEALVLKDPWSGLFSVDQLETARRRLR